MGDGGLSFSFPADAAVPRIFNDYTTFGKFFADAIAGGEVPAGASSVALGDEFFHVFVAQPTFCGANAKRFQLCGIVILNDREDLVETGEKMLRGGDFRLLEFTFVHGDVGFTNKVVHRGQRDGGVQIIGESGVEIVRGLGDAFGHGGVIAGGKFSLFEAVRESAEALDGTCGLLQTVKRKIQLAAIRNAAKRVTQRRGFVPLRKEIADRIEIAERFGHLLTFNEQMFGVQPIP